MGSEGGPLSSRSTGRIQVRGNIQSFELFFALLRLILGYYSTSNFNYSPQKNCSLRKINIKMIIVCEVCKGFMQVVRPDDVRGSHGGYHVACRFCKVEIPVSSFPGAKLVCSYYPKLKEVSEVHSGDGDAGRDQTDATCPKCNHKRAYYTEMQTRSADEAATIFYKCMGCGNQWREN